MEYSILFSSRAKRDLKNLPDNVAKRIIENLEQISNDPHSHVKKLKGNPFFSYRVGKYRVILEIIDDRLIIHVIGVAHRSKVYRDY